MSPADAGPACEILKDASGDAGYGPLTTGPKVIPGDPSDDIISGDIASDGKTVTAVIRLAKVEATNSVAPMGHAWYFDFTAPGATSGLFLGVRTYGDTLGGVQWVAGYNGTTAGVLSTSFPLAEPKGILDTAKNEIRITAPVTAFTEADAKFDKGSKLNTFAIRSFRNTGQGVVPSQNTPAGVRVPLGGVSHRFDSTDETAATATVGAESCVKPVS